MGLARYGRWEEAHRIVRSLVEASPHFDHQLPEVFAGYRRDETPFPIVYPTAARPQAWAAGTPILLLRVLLGLHPDPGSERLVSVSPAGLADWAGPLDLRGVVAFGKAWNVFSRRGEVRVEQA
jgi:glycogen debranching enzyme